jgi:hypothetical protein
MTAKYTESQITELRQYAEFYQLSSLNEAIDYCTKCHFCGKKTNIEIHTHCHNYCGINCANMSKDFNYCCFTGESCKICTCKSKSQYTIDQCNKQKEFKRDDSPITFETKIWSKTISTGKTATISHIVKYKSSTFIVEHDDDEYKIFIKHLGEVLNSYTEIHNKSLYTQEELNEIERIIETPHGWIETYYEIYDPLSIDKSQN